MYESDFTPLQPVAVIVTAEQADKSVVIHPGWPEVHDIAMHNVSCRQAHYALTHAQMSIAHVPALGSQHRRQHVHSMPSSRAAHEPLPNYKATRIRLVRGNLWGVRRFNQPRSGNGSRITSCR